MKRVGFNRAHLIDPHPKTEIISIFEISEIAESTNPVVNDKHFSDLSAGEIF